MTFSQHTTYIPLKQAALKYGVLEETLLECIQSGTIRVGRLPDGGLLVAEQDVDPSSSIRRVDFEDLRGHKISMSDALKKYPGIPRTTIYNWIKAGIVTVIERGYRLVLDESDVAYCAAVFKVKYNLYGGQLAGVPIFDNEGNPYRVKYREVAAMMRAERRRNQKRRR